MPNISEGPIVVFDTSVPAINLALAQVLERLDSIKGLRGDPTIHASPTIGAPIGQQHAARLADLPTNEPSNPLFWLLNMALHEDAVPLSELLTTLWPWMLLAGQLMPVFDPSRAFLSLLDMAAGVYTPTLTNVANLDAITSYEAQYIRVGTVVTVSGKVDADPTLAATSTKIGISLPVASNLGATEDCAGNATCPTIAGQIAAILADTANDRAQMEWIAGDVTNQPMYYTFLYQVI
jgi:hypothetical protein